MCLTTMLRILPSACGLRRSHLLLLRSCCSSASIGPNLSEEELIYSQGTCKDDLFGPIMVEQLVGKGRGVVATKDIELGDLIACVSPAAVLHGPVDETPDVSLLMPQLLQMRPETLPWSVRAALQHLSDGSGGNLEVPAPFWGSPGAAALETALRGTSSSTTSASSSTNHSSSSGASSSSRSSNWPPPEERLARILKVNAFGDDYEDLAAAAARGVGGSSVVGLWPAFSYFNHSCLPSTVHYVVGDKMLVRAVQDIKKGDEVAVSYLGREEFAPADARQEVLQQRWGFKCTCERCRVEAAAPQELRSVINESYVRVMQDLRPEFLAAAEAGDHERLADISERLARLESTVRAAVNTYSPGEHVATATFMHAALYDLYELLYSATQLVGQTGQTAGQTGSSESSERAHAALAALSRCLSIVDTVSRGAELHVYLACALLEQAAALRGADSPQAAAALQLVGQASEARYGKQLGLELWEALQKANTTLAGEFL